MLGFRTAEIDIFPPERFVVVDFSVFEGAYLGIPNIFRKTDNTYPQLPISETLGSEWTDQDLQTVAASIYLLRWSPVDSSAEGIFNIMLKPGFVRGPVS